jgi:peptidoglycan DL-endopeptidase LytE
MRRKVLAALLCSLFLLVSSIAYSAPSHRAKNTNNKKMARKHQGVARELKAAGSRTSDDSKSRRTVAMGQKYKHGSKKHAGKKKSSHTPIEVVEDEQDPAFMEYRVQKGDTVEKIAERFNVDKQDIVDLNGIKKARLSPGIKLVLPRETDESAVGDESVTLNNTKPLKCWKNEEERGVLVKVARSFSGAPYRYGGDSVRGLDCSAFTRKMYEIFDVQLPRTAREQFREGMKVEKGELDTGDLVFFRTKRFAKEPTHVGIYIGDGKFIHASSALKRGVKVDSLNEGYFDRAYTGAVRVKSLDRAKSE